MTNTTQVPSDQSTNTIDDAEIEQFARLFREQYGAEFIGYEQGVSITLAFDSTDAMLKLIGDVKPAMPRVSFNSKKIDGRQIVTITGIRGSIHA